MNKLLKFGIASLSVFVLNAYIQTNAKADEQVATTNIAFLNHQVQIFLLRQLMKTLQVLKF